MICVTWLLLHLHVKWAKNACIMDRRQISCELPVHLEFTQGYWGSAQRMHESPPASKPGAAEAAGAPGAQPPHPGATIYPQVGMAGAAQTQPAAGAAVPKAQPG